MMDLRNNCHIHIQEIVKDIDMEWYGHDAYAPAPCDDGLSMVALESIDLPLSQTQQYGLSQINVLAESNSFGIDLYLQALDILSHR